MNIGRNNKGEPFKMRKKRLLLATEDDEQDALVTPWSLIHALSGAVAKSFQVDFWEWQILHGIYELKDQMKQEEYRNSIINTFGDQAFATLGFVITKRTYDKTTLLLSLALTTLAFVGLGDRVG